MRNRITNQKFAARGKETEIRNKQGFTLIEVIIYITIFSIFFSGIVGFFWQMRQAEIGSDIKRRVKENASQAAETYKAIIRNADSVNAGNSNLDVNPGILELSATDGTWIFDTYTKNVPLGNEIVVVRKLRLSHSGEGPFDLTSDRINVTEFEVNNLAQLGEPAALQLKLGLNNVNPGDDPLYSYSLDLFTTVLLREEL